MGDCARLRSCDFTSLMIGAEHLKTAQRYTYTTLHHDEAKENK